METKTQLENLTLLRLLIPMPQSHFQKKITLRSIQGKMKGVLLLSFSSYET